MAEIKKTTSKDSGAKEGSPEDGGSQKNSRSPEKLLSRKPYRQNRKQKKLQKKLV